MEKFKDLLGRCKCGVHLSVNEHRDFYEKAEQYLIDSRADEHAPPEVIAKMIETDTIIRLQFYPNTPVGFHLIWHHDMDEALNLALSCLE